MKFEEILPALREGKKIRLKEWEEIKYIYKHQNETELRTEDYHVVNLSWEDFFSDNWKVVKEKKKVKLRDLTEEQLERYCDGVRGRICEKCIFRNVSCEAYTSSCWVKHKDLYSDKFLDQEIEIED